MGRERIKNIVIGLLTIALVVSLAFQFSGGSGGDEVPISSGVSMPDGESVPSGLAGSDFSAGISSAEPVVSSAASEVSLPEDSDLSAPEDNIPLEIERKFLVDIEDLPKNMASLGKSYTIEQTYISTSPEVRIRRVAGYQYYFAIKMPRDDVGLSRAEIDFVITQDAYEYLVEMKIGDTINKTRYQFYEGDTYVFVDVYSGALEGLAVVEVQFENVESAEEFVPPEWFGEDVTEDSRYKNAQLATNGLPKPRVLS